jgi:hypothetical protein
VCAYTDQGSLLENENDRLDLQHHIYLLTYNGKLNLCPFEKDMPIHRVLDIGTGTGIWAIDYGGLFISLSFFETPRTRSNLGGKS